MGVIEVLFIIIIVIIISIIIIIIFILVITIIIKISRDPSSWDDQQSFFLCPDFPSSNGASTMQTLHLKYHFFLALDVDECSIANECHHNATCHNTKGSYNCICKNGFKGDGRLNCTGKYLIRSSHSVNDDLSLSDTPIIFVASSFIKTIF